MSAYLIFKFCIAEAGDNTRYIDIAFWPLAGLILVLSTNPVAVNALDRYFRFVFFYALASTGLQLFLFLAFGRLPALAYSNSILVRFGGFLDDPNGFAAVWYMLIGWAYYRFTGRIRFLVEAVLVLCIFLTQSFTAIGFLGIVVLLFSGVHFIRRPRPLLFAGFGAAIVVILIVVRSSLTELVSLFSRTGSVQDHLSQVTTTRVSMSSDWLFGGPAYIAYESWWVGSLVNFGIPWYVLNLGLVATLVLSVFKAFRRARSNQHKAIMSGILLFSCYFVVGSINLPFFGIFPINFLFFFFSYLIFFEKIREDGPQAREIPANRNATLADLLHAKAENSLHRPALD